MRTLLIAALVASTSFATPAVANHEADKPFNTRANNVNKITIDWVTTNNVQKECEKESRSRGLGGFGYALDACAFWTHNSITGSRCTIITAKVTNMGTLGHEARHCFQGSFH